jgi:hypothetical protein
MAAAVLIYCLSYATEFSRQNLLNGGTVVVQGLEVLIRGLEAGRQVRGLDWSSATVEREASRHELVSRMPPFALS